jgi:hypothetical protein
LVKNDTALIHHSPYSLHLAGSDLSLFYKLKSTLEENGFQDEPQIMRNQMKCPKKVPEVLAD